MDTPKSWKHLETDVRLPLPNNTTHQPLRVGDQFGRLTIISEPFKIPNYKHIL